jgi:hypothetical protein
MFGYFPATRNSFILKLPRNRFWTTSDVYKIDTDHKPFLGRALVFTFWIKKKECSHQFLGGQYPVGIRFQRLLSMESLIFQSARI